MGDQTYQVPVTIEILLPTTTTTTVSTTTQQVTKSSPKSPKEHTTPVAPSSEIANSDISITANSDTYKIDNLASVKAGLPLLNQPVFTIDVSVSFLKLKIF